MCHHLVNPMVIACAWQYGVSWSERGFSGPHALIWGRIWHGEVYRLTKGL